LPSSAYGFALSDLVTRSQKLWSFFVPPGLTILILTPYKGSVAVKEFAFNRCPSTNQILQSDGQMMTPDRESCCGVMLSSEFQTTLK